MQIFIVREILFCLFLGQSLNFKQQCKLLMQTHIYVIFFMIFSGYGYGFKKTFLNILTLTPKPKLIFTWKLIIICFKKLTSNILVQYLYTYFNPIGLIQSELVID